MSLSTYVRVQELLEWKFVVDEWGENIPSIADAWCRYNFTWSQMEMFSNCSFEWLCRSPFSTKPTTFPTHDYCLHWPFLLLPEATLIPSYSNFNYMQLICEIWRLYTLDELHMDMIKMYSHTVNSTLLIHNYLNKYLCETHTLSWTLFKLGQFHLESKAIII